MYSIIRKTLFLIPAEKAHYFTLFLLQIAFSLPFIKNYFRKKYGAKEDLKIEVAGLKFKNFVGLAAGFDKNAKYFELLSHLGFGFIEVGTVTPKPQKGNPKPRLFRLPKDKALINRMGFNNDGVDKMVKRLKNRPKNIIIGGNIGKNKNTKNKNAVNDYLICFKKLFQYVDYFAVNVSSPNTPGLRELQDKKPLQIILTELQKINHEKEKSKPIFLKIAPDLNYEQLDDLIDLVQETNISGLIATNTTISRNRLKTQKNIISKIGNGGLSGKPLKEKSTEIIEYLKNKSNGKFPIIGVGGIENANDAKTKIKAGASLIQIYTGFIYSGPSVIHKINSLLNNK